MASGNSKEPTQETPRGTGPYLPLLRGALVMGAFGFAVCVVMLALHIREIAEDPLNSPRLAALKEQLLANPKDEEIKARIRELDLELRGRYFHQLFVNRTGAWLAAGAFGLFLLASHNALKQRQVLPMPRPIPNAAEKTARTAFRSRWAVAGIAVCVGSAMLLVALGAKTSLPSDPAGVERLLGGGPKGEGAAASEDFASDEEMRRNWPSFRGYGGNGVCLETNLPVSWNAESGAGVVWKTKVPAAGFNSPIVWGERVFLSGGNAEERRVFCYSARTGELLWEQPVQNVPGSPAKGLEVPEQTGHAPSTMATDGRRVYALFVNGDLAAFTLDGKPVWAKNLGVPKNAHGNATSLVTWRGRVILQLDQGEAEDNLSKLYAFEGKTGRVLWQRNRPVSTSWATPIVFDAAGKTQIVTLSVPWVISYNAKDGAELWRAGELSNEVTPSPIFAAGSVIAISPNEKTMAIRPDGQGDVTATHIAWSAEDNVPDISSPVATDEFVLTASTPGMLTCFDLKDGKKQWEQDLAMECNASLSLSGNRLYVAGGDGVVLVIEAGRVYKELERNELGEPIFASPAFHEGRIFIRGNEHLYCIGQDAKLAATE